MGLVFKSLLHFLSSLFLLVTVLFICLKLYIGNFSVAESELHPLVVAEMNKQWGLEKPLFLQYADFMKSLVSFDFGQSYVSQQPAIKIIFNAAKNTFELNLIALILILSLSLLISLAEIYFFPQQQKNFISRMSLLFISLPTLLLAPLLIWFFSIFLDWLPMAFLETPWHYVLPVLLLVIKPLSQMNRVLSVRLYEVSAADYVRTAHAKGLKKTSILRRHILKNSLIPYFGYSVPLIAGILSGSAIIEILFSIQGLGKEFIHAATLRDFPVLFGLTYFYGLIILVLSHLFDFIMIKIDPRWGTE